MTETRRNATPPKIGHYIVKHELFWTVLLRVSIPLLSATFYVGQLVGNRRYDITTNEIKETDKKLRDSLKLQRQTIERMSFVSDSALNILGQMPYNHMKLDTSQFHKVQFNIEAAGAALYLNINHKY
jgi:hypothetical protein